MSKHMQILILVALTGAPFAGAVAADANRVAIEGSQTLGPIADAYAEAFQKMDPNVRITVNNTGSGNGAAALIDGRCDIAAMARFMKLKEFKAAVANGVMPVAHVVAMDGVCVIVHPSNKVGGLTVEQVRDIYTGKTTNWKQVGGADLKIVPLGRDTSSGTYELFESVVMAGQGCSAGTQYVSVSPDTHATVAKTTGAIGYVGLGFVDKTVKALKINGIAPTRRTVARGEYPISRALFLFTNGYPKLGSIIHKLVTFHLPPKGQDIIDAKGFVPVTGY